MDRGPRNVTRIPNGGCIRKDRIGRIFYRIFYRTLGQQDIVWTTGNLVYPRGYSLGNRIFCGHERIFRVRVQYAELWGQVWAQQVCRGALVWVSAGALVWVIAAGGQHAPIDECLRDLGELSLRLREHIVYVFATPVLLHPSPGDVVLGLLDNCMCSLACLNGDVLDRDVIKESIW